MLVEYENVTAGYLVCQPTAVEADVAFLSRSSVGTRGEGRGLPLGGRSKVTAMQTLI